MPDDRDATVWWGRMMRECRSGQDCQRVELVNGPYDGCMFPYPIGSTDPEISVPVNCSESRIAVYRLESETRAYFVAIGTREVDDPPPEFP